MAVASAAKMVLLSGSLLDSWRQVVSPVWKWLFMTAAAPTLVYFGAICADFIRWSLYFTKLIELSLGFLSRDHAFTYSFNKVVSLRIIACAVINPILLTWDHSHAFLVESWVSSGGRPIRHWSLQRSWLPLFWDQWEGPGFGSCLLFHLAWEHINL